MYAQVVQAWVLVGVAVAGALVVTSGALDLQEPLQAGVSALACCQTVRLLAVRPAVVVLLLNLLADTDCGTDTYNALKCNAMRRAYSLPQQWDV